jgi:hypothetical protein
MTDAASDEVDVQRLARAVFPIRAKQAHWVPDAPYRPNGPWGPDSQRHRRVLLDEPEDEQIGATAQTGMRERPYRCSLCHEALSEDMLDHHNCQGES